MHCLLKLWLCLWWSMCCNKREFQLISWIKTHHLSSADPAARTLFSQQFVAVFLNLVVQTPRCGGSWGLFHNTGLLSQPVLKISMKWTSQHESIMKDQSVRLQDVHENQYPNLIWQIIQNINSYGRFFFTISSEVLHSHFFLTMLRAEQCILVVE